MRILVVALWLGLVALGLVAATRLEARLDRTGGAPPGSESARVAAVLEKRFPALGAESHLAVVSGRSGAYPRRLAQAVKGRVLRFRPELAGVWIPGDRDVPELRAEIRKVPVPPGVALTLTGPAEAVHDLYAFLGDRLARVELISLAAALIVLLLVFRSLRLTVVGLSVGVVCLLAAPAIVWAVSMIRPITSLNLVVAAVVALAMGLDYPLLFLSRWREEGDLATTRRTAGRTIVTTALVLAGAGLSILWVPLPAMHSIGLTLAAEAAVAACATLTLLPALGLGKAAPAGNEPPPYGKEAAGLVGAVARRVLARPGAAFLLALAVVCALAAPVASLRTWSPSYAVLPPGVEAARGVAALEAGGVAGAVSPILVQSRDLPAVRRALEGDPRIGRVWRPAAGILVVESRLSPDRPEMAGIVKDLREVMGPGGAVGGAAAAQLDTETAIWRAMPAVVATNLAIILLVLGFHLRSVILPLKAVATNALPVLAGLGVVVAVLGRDGLPVQSLTVLIMATLLFAISMDYEIFILSRVREEYDALGVRGETPGPRHTGAISAGMLNAGRVVVGAAAVLLAVFVPYCFLDAPGLRELGVGLSVAILVDATLVRMVLVPSALALLADWNWWHPFKDTSL